MGFVNPGHVYADPQMLNPTSVSDFVAAYGYPAPPQCYRGVIDHCFQGNNCGAATTGQSLSLSLSSYPLELNLQRNEPPINNNNNNNLGSGSGSGSVVELSKNSVPLGPLTGYSSVLKGSRFLRPAQQLLEEICDVGRGILDEINFAAESLSLDPPPLNSSSSNEINIHELGACSDGRKKSKLLSMLDEVYKRYKQYYQQMQTTLAAFESVSGVSGAAPFACLALKAMSKHFRFLKKAIIDQLQLSNKINNQTKSPTFDNLGIRVLVDQELVILQFGVLKEDFRNELLVFFVPGSSTIFYIHTDKMMLATQTGLTRNQVSNWFINARVRLWKPMVEEIHMLETRQNQQGGSGGGADQQQQLPSQINDPGCSDHHETNSGAPSERIGGELSLKRTRKNPIETVGGGSSDGLMNGGRFVGTGVSNGGVSLTLGLHQNADGLSNSYYSRHLGFDLQSEGGVVAVDEFAAAQNRLFGMTDGGGGGCQVMRDFVG